MEQCIDIDYWYDEYDDSIGKSLGSEVSTEPADTGDTGPSAEDVILGVCGCVAVPAAGVLTRLTLSLSLPPSPCPRAADLMMGIRPLEKLWRGGGPPILYTAPHRAMPHHVVSHQSDPANGMERVIDQGC